MIHSLQNLFGSSRKNSDNEITRLYNLYKDSFIAYMLKRNSIDEETVADIYQESFIVLFQDIQSGKLKGVPPSTLKTYLFRIGINKTLKYFEQQRKLPQTDIDRINELMDSDDSAEWMEKQEIANRVVNEMEELCKKVLKLYYWERKSMREIAILMDYKNEQGAKNRKSSCMKTLTERLKDIFRKEGWI